jgi:hypothetical protein
MVEKKDYRLVKLDERSQLKTDLNLGIASLAQATERQFQPHLCLNDEEGVHVIRKVSLDPKEANTEIWLNEQIDYGGGEDVWLNVKFSLFVDRISWPTNNARLSPRQTAYIVKNLPSESQKIALRKIKEWYLEKLLTNFKKGLETISEQFENGDPLIECDYRNRIFDIHGEHDMEVEYTEPGIIGDKLFYLLFVGHTLFHHEQDGYERVDRLLTMLDNERKAAIDVMSGILRTLHG